MQKVKEIFEANIAALKEMINKPNHSQKFTAQEMQQIRVYQANMNLAVSSLAGFCEQDKLSIYRGLAGYYNKRVGEIEEANQNNPDRAHYISNQSSPEREKNRLNNREQILHNTLKPIASGHTPKVQEKKSDKIHTLVYEQFLENQKQHKNAEVDNLAKILHDVSLNRPRSTSLD